MGHIDNLSVSKQAPLLAFSRFFLMELKNVTLSTPISQTRDSDQTVTYNYHFYTTFLLHINLLKSHSQKAIVTHPLFLLYFTIQVSEKIRNYFFYNSLKICLQLLISDMALSLK